MAYQHAGGMGAAAPGVQEHAPQGTEYTLQGVMRFLQIEWHNHERARNAWDIERAEMKAKIAKQEGEIRHSRRLNDQLERQIKMLELALKNERNKKAAPSSPSVASNPSADTSGQEGAKANVKSGSNVDPSAALDHLAQPELSPEERDQYRDKSRKYLEKCMQEIQYLLAPPPHPPPHAGLVNGQLPGLPEPPPQIQDDFMRAQAQRGQQQQIGVMGQRDLMANHQQLPNQQLPLTGTDLSNHSISANDPSYTNQNSAYAQRAAQPGENLNQHLPQALPARPQAVEEALMKGPSAYNAFGASQSEEDLQITQRQTVESVDGWNFGDQQVVPQGSGQDLPITRRPDTDAFPSAGALSAAKSPPRAGPGSHRRRSSGTSNTGRRRSSGSLETHDSGVDVGHKQDLSIFKVKFALRGHLDVVRSVIFTGGGSPSEPEICTAGDDGTIKRWIIPASYGNVQLNHAINDLDIASYFTHRGHEGIITCLASSVSTSFSTGGRASGDGWIFSGGQDATIRVWERGRVDPKATLDGHTDAVWSVCALPGTCGTVFGPQSAQYGGADRILLASGSADGTVKVWAVSAPPHLASPQVASRRGVGGSRRHSVTSGSNHPSSPQPNTATNTPFHYTLVHSISRSADVAVSPTCICPLSPSGDNFVVSYSDSSILIFDTRTGEEVLPMASNETYDGTLATSINTIAATSSASLGADEGRSWGEEQEETVGAGPTGSAQGVEGVVVSGHEDRYIRFFDANSGQCTYTMLAHPSAISSLSLSHDGREAVSAGHDASIRFWSLDKRICTQDITSHRPMRGEGVCSVVWSQDGRYVVSAGGDGVVKVFSR
ncbi:WD40 repeat-like protein [Myriangium duriaei CBS 260.36]|uniref:WD40 repeat-like protein n=1 Tax=Myriangium duriaei CBS 260.36 TaxID=1168546 RepID=A0A9P4JA37_9PEZI|nr:WD40 repeat-like protein [Myriangium duriaei CBS 260.36]